MTTRSKLDRYEQEIIRNALIAVGDEMFDALARTSMSPIIYEALDYSVGVTDSRGDLIAQGNGTTVFLGMIDSLVRDILVKFGGRDDIRPGDVFMSNDPYEGGGTHLSDIAFARPVFWEDELVAFTVNKAHWVDVGGMSPGSFTTDATEIFQEGTANPDGEGDRRGGRAGRCARDTPGQHSASAGLHGRLAGSDGGLLCGRSSAPRSA